MSKLVMGSPLIMQATCCECAADENTAINVQAMLPPRMSAESRLESAMVMVMFATLA
jgi:hypothetical protein